ncbi:MAG: carboxypeptidase regulatory-like domain-containing protein [Sciscionella sp.]
MTPPELPSLDQLATEGIDDADGRTLAQLAALYTTLDPVPAGLIERIQFGITLDALHAEIAELQRSETLVGTRASDPSGAQTVTFTSSTVTTMVTITPVGPERVRVDGWIAPGGGVTVELRTTEDALTTVADADGRFVFDDVPRGLAQFTVRPPDGTSQSPVVTPSIEL